MKSGTRMIATMAAVFFLVPILFAGDTPQPADTSKKDESMSSAAEPAAAAMPKPAGKTRLPFPALSPRQGPAGGGSESRRRARQSGGVGDATPKVEFFVGYTYWRAMPETISNRIDAMNGASGSLAYNFNRHIGLVVDVGGFKVDSLQFTNNGAATGASRVVDADGSVLTFLLGPRLSFRSHSRLTPFVQVLAGAAKASLVTVNGCNIPSYPCFPLPQETAFAMTAGGGLDVRVSHRIALRLIQAEFLYTRFGDPSLFEQSSWQSNVRLSAGIVFRFGGNPPPPPPVANRSPMASCSADPKMVYVGSGDVIAVHASASDPDSDPLTYSWKSSGGAVDGNGPDVRWSSAGAAAGSYSVIVTVSDGRGGTADCSADISVEARPNRPPTIACSADRSSVFAGERIHITTNANDPDSDRLTYAWRANAGQIAGTDANADFDTTGLAPGNYIVTARVDDGRGGAADCSATVEVKAVPPPPQASKINECLFGKPLSARIDNVCKRILDDVALRLQNDPRATTVIIGYSDPKERRPAQVAGDRGTNAVKYLGEKGIDASRVTTRTGTGQAGADAQNRRIEVIYVPEGATY